MLYAEICVPLVLETESSRKGGLNCLASGKDPTAIPQPGRRYSGENAGKEAELK